MADENQPTTTDAVGTAEGVNTSTNDEAQETDDVELEDITVSEEEMDGDTDESEDSDDDEAATKSDDEDAEDSKEDVQDADKEEDTPSEDSPKVDAAEQKRLNDEYAKRRIAEREERERYKAEQQGQYLQEAQDAYDQALDRGLTPEQARVEMNREAALRQLQIDAYNNKVEANTSKLENSIDRAIAEIDLFRSGSPEVKEELAASLDAFEKMYVQRDSNGDPVIVQGDVYQYLQEQAARIKRLTGVGARTQTQNKNKVKARTDTLPTRAPKESKADPDLAAFDAEWDRYS